jgi:uncharacterized protein
LNPDNGRRRIPPRPSAAGQKHLEIRHMNIVNIVTLILLVVGGINWGLVGLANFDLVAALFGEMSALSRVVYGLVGLSALWQLIPLLQGRYTDSGRTASA